MMKRTLAMMILAAMMLSLYSCSDGGSTSAGNDAAVGADNSVEETEPETTWIDTVPSDVKFDGHTFNIGWSTPDLEADECAPNLDDITGDIVGEAVRQRNLLVESKLNISITSSRITDSWTTVLTDLKSMVLAGDTTYDVYDIGTWFMFQASINGLLHKLDDVKTLDLSNEWWEHELNEMSAIDGKTHYMANGMINYLDDYGVSCLYFNKPLCTDLGLEHPYEMVRNGEWTYDKFIQYVDVSSADLDGNGVFDENDRYGLAENSGLLCRILPSFGTPVVMFDEAGEGIINQSESFYNQLDRVMTTLLDANYQPMLLRDGPLGYEKADTVFPGGRALFFGEMVRNITGFRESMEQDFGVLPYPKYTEEQEHYYSSYNTVWGTSYGIPVTNMELDRTGWILEVMGYYSTDTIYPATIEKNILTKNVRDEESADMLNILFNNKFYELGQWGTSVYGNLCTMASTGNNNFASSMKVISKVNAKEFGEVKNYYNFGN
ncbi:MAG: extracellular solute-binding protein [Clostridia bacterium]|nr:extracellular solute-binding protein [Clostridia bacterium]